MFILRTDLTASEVRRLLRHGCEILAIETDYKSNCGRGRRVTS